MADETFGWVLFALLLVWASLPRDVVFRRCTPPKNSGSSGEVLTVLNPGADLGCGTLIEVNGQLHEVVHSSSAILQLRRVGEHRGVLVRAKRWLGRHVPKRELVVLGVFVAGAATGALLHWLCG